MISWKPCKESVLLPSSWRLTIGFSNVEVIEYIQWDHFSSVMGQNLTVMSLRKKLSVGENLKTVSINNFWGGFASKESREMRMMVMREEEKIFLKHGRIIACLKGDMTFEIWYGKKKGEKGKSYLSLSRWKRHLVNLVSRELVEEWVLDGCLKVYSANRWGSRWV